MWERVILQHSSYFITQDKSGTSDTPGGDNPGPVDGPVGYSRKQTTSVGRRTRTDRGHEGDAWLYYESCSGHCYCRMFQTHPGESNSVDISLSYESPAYCYCRMFQTHPGK